MSKVVLVLGKSGTGKSYSVQGLNSKETYFIDMVNKGLSFKGCNKNYNATNKNICNIPEYLAAKLAKEDNGIRSINKTKGRTRSEIIVDLLKGISEKRTDIKNIVIDDFTYMMREEYYDRADEKGYDKYAELARNTQRVISFAKELRPDITVFIIQHLEDVYDGQSIVSQKPSTIGKMLDTSYNICEVVPIILVGNNGYDEEGKATYSFVTERCKINGIEFVSRSPEGMFESRFIPNDLGLVRKAIDEYYG